MLLYSVVVISCKKDKYDDFYPINYLDVVKDGITNIKDHSAIVVGKLIVTGNGQVTKAGFCWDTVPNATVHIHSIEVKDVLGELTNQSKVFSRKIESFNSESKYYIRAYAVINGKMIYRC